MSDKTGARDVAQGDPAGYWISPRYKVADWARLELADEQQWQVAVSMFEDRIRSRFLDMVDVLTAPLRDRLDPRSSRPGALHPYTPGFAIMAIDCLLVETLQQFIDGVDSKESARAYTDFLVGRYVSGVFMAGPAYLRASEPFTQRTATLFYKTFRCGIYHRGELLIPSTMTTGDDVPLFQVINGPHCSGLRLNRVKFHRLMHDAYCLYVNDLRKHSDPMIAQRFVTKMNYISGAIPPPAKGSTRQRRARRSR